MEIILVIVGIAIGWCGKRRRVVADEPVMDGPKELCKLGDLLNKNKLLIMLEYEEYGREHEVILRKSGDVYGVACRSERV